MPSVCVSHWAVCVFDGVAVFTIGQFIHHPTHPLQAWELDRLLARLATHGNSSSGRRSRAQRQAARASRAAAVRAAAESGNVSSVLSGGAGGSTAAGRSGDGEAWSGGGSEAASPPIAVGRDGHNAAGSGADGDANGAAYPASWPPASHRRQYSRVSVVPAMARHLYRPGTCQQCMHDADRHRSPRQSLGVWCPRRFAMSPLYSLRLEVTVSGTVFSTGTRRWWRA